MLWIIFTLISVFIFSLINIIDKYTYDKLTNNAHVPMMVSGFVGLIASLVVYLFNGFSHLTLILTIIAISSGILLAIGIYFYIFAMKADEVSRVIALFSLEPLVILFFAVLFLGEHFSKQIYLGILLLVIGAFFLTTNGTFLPKNKKMLLYIALSILFFSAFSIITKYMLNYADYWTVLAYSRIGMFIALLPVYFLKFREIKMNIKEYGNKSIAVMAANSLITFIGYIFLILAFSYGFVSIVSAFASIQPLIVLVFSIILSIFFPHIIKEDISKSALILKGTGILFLIIGVILIT